MTRLCVEWWESIQITRRNMVTHSVYFWLKPGITPEETQTFINGAKSLLSIETVQSGMVGGPADTEKRPIIDSSYDYSLILSFDSIADHDVYQAHPVHDAFRELAHLWVRVQIYDTESI